MTETTASSPGQRQALTVGVGAGGLATADMVLNIGPQHPATHGVLRLQIVVDGERIVSAEPIIGYMHRGAEKLFEVRDYRQILVLANRHDWLSAFSNELGVVLGVEQMLGMEVPERAVWARTALAEINRVLSHLMFLGSYPLELGAITPVFHAFREREELQAVMEEVSGGRMHYMFNRVGGLKEDLPAGWMGRVDKAIANVRARMPDLERLIVGNEILEGRTRGVGRAPPRPGDGLRRVGPHRACQRPRRRPAPRRALPRLRRALRRQGPWPGRHPHGRRLPRRASRCSSSRRTWRSTSPRPASTGSCSCRRGRSTSSCPRCSRCPRARSTAPPRTPSASTATTSSPAGEKTPWRLKLRSASFNNVSVLSEMLPGQLIADMVAILGSMFFVVGDVDK